VTEKKKPKAIILERNDAVREHVASVLSKEGWDVTGEQAAKSALDTLAKSKKRLFALFICNFELPKMQGDDILQKAKDISPLTQRMLMVPADKPETLISAINKAEINACIISPFKDEALINQVKNCFQQFKRALKRQQLKRITVHQNKQMLKIAQKFKKKDDTYTQLLDDKKAEKLMLKSKKRGPENKNILNTDISLSDLIEHKNITPAPDALMHEFITISTAVRDLFDQIMTRHNSNPVDFDIGAILNDRKHEENGTDTNNDAIGQTEKKQTDSKESNPEKHDPKQILPENECFPSGLIEKIIKEAFIRTINTAVSGEDKPPETDDTCTGETDDRIFDDYFEISISETHTKAYIKRIKEYNSRDPQPGLSDLLDMLKLNRISYGILYDDAIENWMWESDVEKIVIAKGENPVYGQNGEIKFNFKTDFKNPGKINEDGSIDFRERGDIPYIKKGTLLAEKIFPKDGKPGISVFGTPIPVNEAVDPVFTAGSGTELSKDGRLIHAAVDGQPHVDALGSISVNPELVIAGDVDYETGNIDFSGNIIVKGTIKEGFTVKGINLTAKEAKGAALDLSGDLNISTGITDSTISTHGNIYAKFINHSNIMGFGDLFISKEIIDSNIIISGSCQNPTGHIISSQITAKMGIHACNIGTSSSQPAKIKVGIDGHIETLKKQIINALEISAGKSNLIKDDIKELEIKDRELYRQISEKGSFQDNVQLEIKELKTSLSEFEKENNLSKLQLTSNKIRKLLVTAKETEQELNTIFKTQDRIVNKIEQLKNHINRMKEKNKTLVLEKKALKEFSKKDKPLAVVTVAKTITQDTIIKGPHASIVLREDVSRCKIQELDLTEEGLQFHEMNISDL